MKSYTIKQTSPWLLVSMLLITVSIGMGFLLLLKQQQVLSAGGFIIWPFIIGMFWISYYMSKHIATAETEIIIDEVGIRQTWLTQFLFSNKADRDIKWIEIREYVYQPERNYHILKIKLTSGSVIKIHHDVFDHKKDDFNQLQLDLAEKVDQLNKTGIEIGKGKTMYETKAALVMAILLVVFLLVAVIVLIFLASRGAVKPKNVLVVFAGISPILYFLAQVYAHRQKKNESV